MVLTHVDVVVRSSPSMWGFDFTSGALYIRDNARFYYLFLLKELILIVL